MHVMAASVIDAKPAQNMHMDDRSLVGGVSGWRHVGRDYAFNVSSDAWNGKEIYPSPVHWDQLSVKIKWSDVSGLPSNGILQLLM